MYNGYENMLKKSLMLCGPLQAENSELQRRLEEQTARLQRAEGLSEDRGRRVEGLERLLGSLAVESTGLKEKVAAHSSKSVKQASVGA